jgi:hypothetical protein
MNTQQQFTIMNQIENEGKRKPGRPTVEGSKRQERMLMLEQRRNENHGIMPLGRPVNPFSDRQQRLAELMERRSAGLAKRGRPKMTDEEKAAAKLKREQDMATLAMLRSQK